MTLGSRRRPVAIDLYAGAGGLSYGAEQAGFDVVAAAEFDPVHALVHRYNMPNTPVLCRDLSEGSPQEVAAEIVLLARAGLVQHGRANEEPSIDAIIGGPPCQGFSVGGVRDVSDERNDQLLRFVDLVVEIQPKVFCLENVAGLLEHRFKDLREEAIRRLMVDGGYALSGFDHAVNAVDFGVPQSRRRVIMLGSREGEPPILEAQKVERVTVVEALAGLPELSKYRRLLTTDEVQLEEEDLASLLGVSSEYAQRLVGAAVDALDMSVPRRYDPGLLTSSLRTVHTKKTVQRFARTAQGEAEKVSRLFRLGPNGQARTLRAGTGTDRGSHTSPRPIHPVKNRVITVREAARLHGYPDWFRFNATNWHGHRQVGNSVPPPLATAAGRALLAALGVEGLTRPGGSLVLGDPSWLSFNGTQARAELRRQSESGWSRSSRLHSQSRRERTLWRMSRSESWASNPLARKVMQGNRSRDTIPEIAVRRLLHTAGFRYPVSIRPEPGLRRTADIVFTRLKIAVFIDGCYWHGCPKHCHLTFSNHDYSATKIEGNKYRDIHTNALLRSAGWTVLRYWEHEPAEEVVTEIADTLRRPEESRAAANTVYRH